MADKILVFIQNSTRLKNPHHSHTSIGMQVNVFQHFNWRFF
jgi:hypothetical protein